MRIDSPRAILAVLPPEAEEFFQALDEWADSNSKLTRPKKKMNVEKINEVLQQTENRSNNSSIMEELYLDVDEEAPFLSEEDYLDLSRKSLGLDPEEFGREQQPTEDSFRNGLLNFITQETVEPAEPDGVSEAEALGQFLEKLRHNGRHAADYFNETVAEELDRQVFAEETGHQKSSALFRSSLTNATVREDAIHERRTRNARALQEKQAADLERFMKEFMEGNVWNDDQSGEDDLGLEIARCSVCQRMLTANEMDSEVCSQCKPTEQRFVDPSVNSGEEEVNDFGKMPHRSSPWIKAIDPDTNEAFFWNQDTEEMRWEAPAYSDEFE